MERIGRKNGTNWKELERIVRTMKRIEKNWKNGKNWKKLERTGRKMERIEKNGKNWKEMYRIVQSKYI